MRHDWGVVVGFLWMKNLQRMINILCVQDPESLSQFKTRFIDSRWSYMANFLCVFCFLKAAKALEVLFRTSFRAGSSLEM